MPQSDIFTYGDTTHSLENFARVYGTELPAVVIFVDGFNGADEDHTISNQDVFRIVQLKTQKRVMCRDDCGNKVSIPSDCRVKFQILNENGEVGEPTTLSTLLKGWEQDPHPVENRFQIKDNPMTLCIRGVEYHSSKQFGTLIYEHEYEEMYLAGFQIVSHKISTHPILIPCNTPADISLVTGLADSSVDYFENFLYNRIPGQQERLWALETNKEIFVFPNDSSSSDVYTSEHVVQSRMTASAIYSFDRDSEADTDTGPGRAPKDMQLVCPQGSASRRCDSANSLGQTQNSTQRAEDKAATSVSLLLPPQREPVPIHLRPKAPTPQPSETAFQFPFFGSPGDESRSSEDKMYSSVRYESGTIGINGNDQIKTVCSAHGSSEKVFSGWNVVGDSRSSRKGESVDSSPEQAGCSTLQKHDRPRPPLPLPRTAPMDIPAVRARSCKDPYKNTGVSSDEAFVASLNGREEPSSMTLPKRNMHGILDRRRPPLPQPRHCSSGSPVHLRRRCDSESALRRTPLSSKSNNRLSIYNVDSPRLTKRSNITLRHRPKAPLPQPRTSSSGSSVHSPSDAGSSICSSPENTSMLGNNGHTSPSSPIDTDDEDGASFHTPPSSVQTRQNVFTFDDAVRPDSPVVSGGRGVGITSLHEVPSDITNLSIDDVADCLMLLNLNQHVEEFRDQQIDGHLLTILDAATLQEDFGVSLFIATKLTKFAEGWRPNIE